MRAVTRGGGLRQAQPERWPAARCSAGNGGGSLILVGAGPGDPDLITVGGLRAIREADVVVYDRLVNPDLVDEAPPSAPRVNAGKRAGGHGMSQASINELLCSEALAGARVVRLKGGDPFVFGRGAEEIAAAVAAGIPVQVIPGVSAAIAAPAAAGISLTHRGVASGFTVVTAHEDPTKPCSNVRWDLLAHTGCTLVILMGAARLYPVVAALLEAGMPPATPAAVVESATTAAQRLVVGTLETIGDLALAVGMRAPATIVIGEVVRLGSWFDKTCPADSEVGRAGVLGALAEGLATSGHLQTGWRASPGAGTSS